MDSERVLEKHTLKSGSVPDQGKRSLMQRVKSGISEKATKDGYWNPGWWIDEHHQHWHKGRIEEIANWMVKNESKWRTYGDVATQLHCSKTSVMKAKTLYIALLENPELQLTEKDDI